MSTLLKLPSTHSPARLRLRASKKVWTERELLALPKEDGKYELVNGELTLMSPASLTHGDYCAKLLFLLYGHVVDRQLGKTFDGQTGYWMKSGNLRAPDISFISKARLEKMGKLPKGFSRIAPDLAVEILSASESKKNTQGKVEDYINSGVSLIWVINPKTKSVRVYRDAKSSVLLGADDLLSGEEVVPGFSMRVGDLF